MAALCRSSAEVQTCIAWLDLEQRVGHEQMEADKDLRIRPELRYDRYSGPGRPFGGQVPTRFFGDEETQWVASLDVTWHYTL